MGYLPLLAIVVVALAAGVAVQLVRKPRYRWEWLNVAAGAAFGGYFFSEAIPSASANLGIANWGPQWDGFYFIPGIIGGAIIALILDLAMRSEPALETSET